jgi:hypothetical protein
MKAFTGRLPCNGVCFKMIYMTGHFLNKVFIRITVFLLCLILLKQAVAQRDTIEPRNFGISFTVEAGKILKIYPVFPELKPALISRLDLDWQTQGRQSWNKHFNYPVTGIQLVYGSLGNNDVLGTMAAVIPNLKFRLFPGHKGNVSLRFGMGFAWFSKPYDAFDNPENLLVGSAITNITSLQLMYSTGLFHAVQLQAGAGFLHFSNGQTQLPNVGINLPSLHLGLGYRPHYERKEVDIRVDLMPSTDIKMNLEFGLGWHEFGETTEPTGGIKYPVYSVGISLSKNTGYIHNWQLGLWLNHYASFRDYIVSQDFYDEQVWLNSSTLILYAGHEFMLGRLGLDTKFGLYLYNPFRRKYNDDVLLKQNNFKELSSNKLGVNYYFFDTKTTRNGLFIGIHIKANLGQADFAEISAGYRF